jgi:IPT/TIG domain
MTKDSAVLSIDFIVGFTVFLLALIWVLSMIPGMLIGLQAYTIDYDAVAYRTGVILVEDPGAPADPGWPVIRPRTDPWEFKTDKRDVARLGLAISRDTPNILSENKVNRFFDRSLLNTTTDYRNKILFSTFPYSYNISLLDKGQNRSVGYGIPKNSSYGYIQRFVKIKGASNATINESYILNSSHRYVNDINVTTHIFSILIDNTKLHDEAPDLLHGIDLESEQIVINITDLNSTGVNPYERIITLSDIYVLNNVPISTFPGIVITTNNETQSLPANNVKNISLRFSPVFFKTIYDSQGDIPLNVNLTFILDAPGKFLNSSAAGPFEYDYTPGNNVMQPQLRDAVLEVAIWSGETTSMVTHLITASAGNGGSISPSGEVNVIQGATQTFTITPNVGYVINDVVVDTLSRGALTSYTFTNVDAPHTITATFTTGASNIITSLAGAGGKISPPGLPPGGAGGAVNIAYGADQSFTITPDAGFVINDVVVDGVSKGPVTSYTFINVQNIHTIAASFKPGPTFGNIVPAVGPVAGNTPVTITGTGFTGATSVTFGGTAATSFLVVSDFSITAVTPAHATGAVNVVITTPGGGTATGTNAYTFVPLLVADFTYTQGNQHRVTVTDSSTGGAPAYAVTRDWDWGDGTAHGTNSPETHNYAAGGSYTVTLIVTRTIDGATSTITKSVTAPG